MTSAGLGFLLLFFVSGFAALLYQVVWQRILTFFGGADVYSVTIIVAAFMGGLGFGSLAGGLLADRIRAERRLLAFAACELAVALFAVFSTDIYYDFLYARLGTWSASRLATALVVFAVTLWPTFFMGMSLPFLAKALSSDRRNPSRWIPLLYGANTVGAACGSLFAAAVLFRTLDFVSSVRLGAALSFFCAAGALLLSPLVAKRAERLDAVRDDTAPAGNGPPAVDLAPAPAKAAVSNRPAQFALRTWIGIYALSGFVALSLEILWFRVLGVVLKSNSFTFGHLLGIYLLGVGLGALLATLRWLRPRSPVSSFALLQAAIPIVAAVALVLLVSAVDRVRWAEPLWNYLGAYETLSREALSAQGSSSDFWLLAMLYGVIPVAMMGLPTLLMGLTFAYLQQAVQTDLEQLGRRVGWLQTGNIVGSMIGAMVTGLLLLDWFGTMGTLRLLVGCSTLFLLLYARTAPSRARQRAAIGGIAAALLLAYSLPPAVTLWSRLHRSRPAEIIQGEDSSGLSVLKMRTGSQQTIVHANGLGQGTLPFGGVHTLLGSVPALIHPNPQSIAVIGLGSGDTLFAVGGRAETTRIDSIEIIAPELDTLQRLDRIRQYPGLRMLLRDTRMDHWFTDGRAFVKNGQRGYDIIEADALRPTSAYAGNLFSVEYFELLRDSLNPGGLAVTWTPTPRVVDSFVSVFPYVVIFPDLALGSMSPVPYDPELLKSRLSHPFTRDYYRDGGVDIETVLAPYLTARPEMYGPEFDRATLIDVNRDLFPKDEFAIPYRGRSAAGGSRP